MFVVMYRWRIQPGKEDQLRGRVDECDPQDHGAVRRARVPLTPASDDGHGSRTPSGRIGTAGCS